MKNSTIFLYSKGILLTLLSTSSLADAPIIINNNNGEPSSSCNYNPPPLDPRVPPSGVYSTHNKDGSSNTQYTTGETKPYIVDNNCNNSAAPIQPYTFVPAPNPMK